MECAWALFPGNRHVALSQVREACSGVHQERRLVLVHKVAGAAYTAHLVLAPTKALAAPAVAEHDFTKVIGAALQIADWLAVGVFMFAGAAWMFGDRTRAMQHMIGGATGYLIIRKSMLIRDFLRGL